MVRFEERRIAGVGKIAWAPRGPVGEPLGRQRIAQELRDCLREHGFTLVASNPWQACYSGQEDRGLIKVAGGRSELIFPSGDNSSGVTWTAGPLRCEPFEAGQSEDTNGSQWAHADGVLRAVPKSE